MDHHAGQRDPGTGRWHCWALASLVQPLAADYVMPNDDRHQPWPALQLVDIRDRADSASGSPGGRPAARGQPRPTGQVRSCLADSKLGDPKKMDDQFLQHALAVTGTVLYVVRAAPATAQIARRRGIDPEAATTFGLLLLTGLWWVAYSLEVHNLPSLVSAVLGLIAPAYGLIVLWRMRAVGRGVAFVVLAGLVVTFLEEELTPRALGVTAAVGAAGIAVPQAARLLRDRDASAADASVGTWALVAFNALVWLGYGVLVGHPLLGAAGLLQLPCSMIVIHRALQERKGGVAA